MYKRQLLNALGKFEAAEHSDEYKDVITGELDKLIQDNTCLLYTSLVEGVHAYLDADYNYVGKIQHLCIQHDITVVSTEYSDNVIFELMMEKQVLQKFEKTLTEMSSGRIGLREIKEVKMYRDGRGILSL